MRGRRPKPTMLKLMLGNQGQRRMNMNEPIPARNLEGPPVWLTAEQRALWLDVHDNLPAGVIKKADTMTFAVWVCEASVYMHAMMELSLEKNLLSKRAMQLRKICSEKAAIMRPYATELGLSPAARPRIQITPEPGEKAKSDFEKLLG